MLVWNYPGCMEFPGLYGIFRAVWNIQTSFQPIKYLETRSVRVGHVIISHTDTQASKKIILNMALILLKKKLSRFSLRIGTCIKVISGKNIIAH